MPARELTNSPHRSSYLPSSSRSLPGVPERSNGMGPAKCPGIGLALRGQRCLKPDAREPKDQQRSLGRCVQMRFVRSGVFPKCDRLRQSIHAEVQCLERLGIGWCIVECMRARATGLATGHTGTDPCGRGVQRRPVVAAMLSANRPRWRASSRDQSRSRNPLTGKRSPLSCRKSTIGNEKSKNNMSLPNAAAARR